MRKHLFLLFIIAFPAISLAYTNTPILMASQTHEDSNFAKIDAVFAHKTTAGTVKISLSEAKTGKPITTEDLETVHEMNFHLLVIDPTLADYHHLHPVETKIPGVYEFTLPKPKPGSKTTYYRAFADITPTATGKQEYIPFVIGKENRMMPQIDKTPALTAKAIGLDFKLDFDKAPQAGEASMAKITITRKGKPFTTLEPVMGAFAHIVAFSRDGHEVAHIHPMGDEPKSATERGSSPLEFHFEPTSAGFTKIFAQVKIKGKDVYVPFGVDVAE